MNILAKLNLVAVFIYTKWLLYAKFKKFRIDFLQTLLCFKIFVHHVNMAAALKFFIQEIQPSVLSKISKT